MAVIHRTTLTPGKLELLAAWLPRQPWYQGTAGEPELAKAGGFRLDDPDGEVGIEFIVVTDTSGGAPVSYLVPLSYRGAPLPGADQALIGTGVHGVLGPRWIYDGAHDPVVVGQLLALLQGRAEPQAQNVSNTPDNTVTCHPAAAGDVAGQRRAPLRQTSAPRQTRAPRLTRVLQPAPELPDSPPPGQGYVTGTWQLPDGTQARGVFATLDG
jgi:hypothetical protein